MKKLKKELVLLFAVAAFLGSYIGSAQAKNYYYYDQLEGLVYTNPETYPFCEVDDCAFNNPTNIDIDIAERLIKVVRGAEVTNSYSVTAGAVVILGSSDELLINPEDIDHDDVNYDISFTAPTTEGMYRIYLNATVDGQPKSQDYFELEVVDYLCDNTQPGFDPLASFECEDGACDGSLSEVYLIGDAAGKPLLAKHQLLCMSNNQSVGDVLSSSYKLMADVYFYANEKNEDWDNDGVADGNDLEPEEELIGGWTPIGSPTSNFTGDFYGNGHVISNLYINNNTQYQGLFGYVNGSNISKLGVDYAQVEGSMHVGILTGYASSADIQNCYSSGSASSSGFYTGGLIGYLNNSSLVSDSYSSANTISSSFYAGGLVGYVRSSDVNNSFATGSVEGSDKIGGFIGGVSSSVDVSDSYATGGVYASSKYAGGFIGMISGHASIANTNIDNCFANGNVETAAGYSGGFAGEILGGVTIEECYATGNAESGGNQIGGFSGITGMSGWFASYTDGLEIIKNSYATGNVTSFGSGTSRIGGFTGQNHSGYIENVYASGSVDGGVSVLVGALVGNYHNPPMNTGGYAINSSMTGVGSGHLDLSNYCSVGFDSGCDAVAINTNWSPSIWSGKGVSSTPILYNTNISNTLSTWDTNIWDLTGANPTFK